MAYQNAISLKKPQNKHNDDDNGNNNHSDNNSYDELICERVSKVNKIMSQHKQEQQRLLLKSQPINCEMAKNRYSN